MEAARLTWAVRASDRTLEPRAALERPVEILVGVTAQAATALSKVAIDTVQDLATSSLFGNAAEICALCEHGTGRFARIGRVPRDVLRSGLDLSMATLPLAPIRSLASQATEQEMDSLAGAIDARSVHDLAYWPPYRTSLELFSAAYETAAPANGDAADSPQDLVPGTGRYPTERVQYEQLLFDSYLSPASPSKDLSAITPIDVATLIGSDDGYTRPAIGTVLTFTQSWFTQALALGNLIHSVALGPGESTRIAMIDWSRRTRASATEEIAEGETLTSDLTRTRALSEITSAVANETQSGNSVATNFAQATQRAESTGRAGLAAPFPFGPISPGVETGGTTESTSTGFSVGTAWSTSTGHRDVAANLAQNITDSTHQASHVARSRRASIVREVSQEESETVSTRTLTNYNHMHALTVEYYEVVQLYRTVVELTAAERCVFIPMKLIDFRNPSLVDRFRGALGAAALSASVREALEYPTGTTRARAPGVVKLPSSTIPKPAGSAGSPLDDLSPDSWNTVDILAAQRVTGGVVRALPDGRLVLPSDAIVYDVDFASKESSVKPLDLNIQRTDGTISTLTYGQSGWVMGNIVRPRVDEVARMTLSTSGVASAGTVGWLSILFSFKGKSFRVVVPLKLDPTGLTDALSAATVPADVMAHLQENRLYYSQAVWRSLDSATLGAVLADIRFPAGSPGQTVPLVQLVDPTPVTLSANYLVLRLSGDSADTVAAWLKERRIKLGTKREDLVPVPSGGVFAEAVLGRFNSAEKLDLTRFWNWQDSPPPFSAPEIAPVQTGSRGESEPITPGQLGAPVLNVMNAPQMPDPQGMGAALAAVQNGAMFRDMSGLAAAIGMTTAGLAAAQQGATAAGQQAGQNAEVAAQFGAKVAEIAAKLVAAYFTGGASLAAGAGVEGLAGLAGGISGQGAKINHGKDLDSRDATKTDPGDADGTPTEPGGGADGNPAPANATPPGNRGGGNEEAAFRAALGTGGGPGGVMGQMLASVLGASPGTGAGADAGTPTPKWNAYVYVVGTDVAGGGDFNRMRELLVDETSFVEPWVAVTYDYKNNELRKNWKDKGGQSRPERFSGLGDMNAVYADIAKIAPWGRIRHLHFLTHASGQAIFYKPNSASTAADLRTHGAGLRAALASDALIKVHGCAHDQKLSLPMREFCEKGTGGPQTVAMLRGAVGTSYPVALASVTGLPVWAAPIGAGAFYGCSYLSSSEQGRRFCIETDFTKNPDPKVQKEGLSWGYAIRFFDANYESFFQRATGERVFDRTFHMKYRGTLASSAKPPVACAAMLP